MTTDIGSFTAPNSAVGDGAAVLSIRPEAVELGAEGQNSVGGTVLSHVYAGCYARFQIRIGDVEIEAVTEPGQVKLFADGDNIPLKFDPDKIWVLGPNSTGQSAGADSAG